MMIYHGLEDFAPLRNAIVTIGTFDGVHLGHQKILKRLSSVAQRIGGETVLLTFWPHPRIVLDPDFDLKLLTTMEEKAALLEKYGIDHLVRIRFTEEFADLSSEEYIRRVLVEKIGTKKLVIGHDHRFGKNRVGNFADLVAKGIVYGFEVEEIPKQEIDDITISSTRIRHALNEGNIHIGNEYLGRAYSITGKVIKGDELGRKIGFPTANISVNSKHKLIPCDGSYAVQISFPTENRLFSGMMNMGYRPTVDGRKHSIEVHIFNFDDTIYGKTLTISFLKLIRREEKFDSLEDLKIQLQKDKLLAQQILKSN